MDATQILNLHMDENDSGADTVRGYLKALLTRLWEEEESFSGKRPFGNSGWQYDVMTALVKGGAVAGDLSDDEYKELLDFDENGARSAIAAAIAAL